MHLTTVPIPTAIPKVTALTVAGTGLHPFHHRLGSQALVRLVIKLEMPKILFPFSLKRCILSSPSHPTAHIRSCFQCSNATARQTQRPRPKPRPVKRLPSPFRDSEDDAYPPTQPIATTRAKEPDPSTLQTREFPTLSPLRGDTGAETPPTIKTTHSKAVKARSEVKRRIPKLPNLSSGVPLRSSNNGMFSSNSDPDEDEIAMRPDDEPLTRGGLRPFPMEVPMQSIGGSPHLSREPSKPASAKEGRGKNKTSTQKISRPLRKFPMTDDMFQDVSSTPPSSQPK